MVTIKEIAKKAKTSTATVSRAVNNPKMVAPKTRKRIAGILKKHNYAPNQLARGLVRGKSGALSLITPTSENFLNAFYFREVFLGINKAASEKKYNILIEQAKQGENSQLQSKFPVDGYILISPSSDDPVLKQIEDRNLKAMVINSRSDILSWVDLDNVGSARAMVGKLVECGHRNIAIITGRENVVNSTDRLKGYQLALEENGIKYNPEYVVKGSFFEEKAYRKTKGFLSCNPEVTAIFACNDLMAIGAIRAIQEKKKKVPGDMSVAGFDDIALVPYISPAVTTVRQPFYMMGAYAVSALVDQIEGRKNGKVKKEFPGEIVVRESTASVKKSK